jgi:DNA-binding NarL/FixJ family response regulator
MPLDELVEKIEGGSLRPRISPTGDRARLKTAITQLDARERAILTLMAEGESDAEIAETLWIDQKNLRLGRPDLIRKLHGQNERDPSG